MEGIARLISESVARQAWTGLSIIGASTGRAGCLARRATPCWYLLVPACAPLPKSGLLPAKQPSARVRFCSPSRRYTPRRIWRYCQRQPKASRNVVHQHKVGPKAAPQTCILPHLCLAAFATVNLGGMLLFIDDHQRGGRPKSAQRIRERKGEASPGRGQNLPEFP
jgi:hypothetical protein